MTEDRRALFELPQKSGDGDFLRSVATAVLQISMEADVAGLIGADRHERSTDRLNSRNGYRDRSLDTRPGALRPRIPERRQGACFPPFLEPRKIAREGAGRGDPGSLDRRRVDPPGSMSWSRRGADRASRSAKSEAVQGYRRTGQGLPRPAD